MAAIRKAMAVATLALAFLLPARGQMMTAGCPVTGSDQNGNLVQCTLGTVARPLMFGVDPNDPTKTWTTTLWLTNRTTTVHEGTASLKTVDGAQVISANSISIIGGTATFGGMYFSVAPQGQIVTFLQGVAPTTVAVPAQMPVLLLQNSIDGLPDIVPSALVQQTDANGKVYQSYEVIDPSMALGGAGNGFIVPFNVAVANSDTNLLLLSASGGTVTIAVCAQEMYASSSSMVASIQVYLPPATLVAAPLSQLFAGNKDLANFIAQTPPAGWYWSPNEDVIMITGTQPFALSVSRVNTYPADGSMIQTQSYAFPLPQPPSQQ